jgi:DNA-directed RNA polymerase specialized sigma24 family protein
LPPLHFYKLTLEDWLAMQKHWDITQDAFDKFLAWLDSDRERAGARYEDIRRKLISIFTCRGCRGGEDLADETINRVITRLQEIADTYTGDPAYYFYGVARNVHLEHVRKPAESFPLPIPESLEEKERRDQCLELCMKDFVPGIRSLLLEYYSKDKSAKIAHRKKMAEQLGMSGTTLRVKMHRIRASLQICVETCLKQEA